MISYIVEGIFERNESMGRKDLDDEYFNEGYQKYSLEDNFYEESKVKLPQSKPGIFSFVLALLSVVIFIISIILLVKTNDQGIYSEVTPSEIMGTIFLLLSGILSFTGVALGIAGVVTKNRKKVYPIIGIIINLLIALFFIAIIITAISGAKEEQYEYNEHKSIQVNSNGRIYSMASKYNYGNS
ncbi:hypothetical protein [uncultured Clostridium sp.]|uniref:hypothetical protein n=1 Tax=uncultured Clostridium sp. TaxID=59620 RepID=UPI0028E57946|nr:hypothetical protein [uncultured Clostridium sp.]